MREKEREREREGGREKEREGKGEGKGERGGERERRRGGDLPRSKTKLGRYKTSGEPHRCAEMPTTSTTN